MKLRKSQEEEKEAEEFWLEFVEFGTRENEETREVSLLLESFSSLPPMIVVAPEEFDPTVFWGCPALFTLATGVSCSSFRVSGFVIAVVVVAPSLTLFTSASPW